MELRSFRVTDYRSVEDSGEVKVGDRNVLVGRNESGKTNLLKALLSLNPPGELRPLDETRHYPRDRHIGDFDGDIVLASSVWELEEEEKDELGSLHQNFTPPDTVQIDRHYAAKRTVRFPNQLGVEVPRSYARDLLAQVIQAAQGGLSGQDQQTREQVTDALKTTEEKSEEEFIDLQSWRDHWQALVSDLQSSLSNAEFSLSPNAQDTLQDLNRIISEQDDLVNQISAARDLIKEQISTFVYVEDYPGIDGSKNMRQYLQRKQNNNLNDGDIQFEKLCKVAGLDPQQLMDLLDEEEIDKRNNLANRAGASVSSNLQDLWSDRDLEVRFNLDGPFLETYVIDDTHRYAVEVNLDERSKGFQWFFSFYTTFRADTEGGRAEDAILLLDEPGLHLHATSQKDLLDHLEEDFENQIIYTTHSPFMVPPENIQEVRTVNISDEEGTTVSNSPAGDTETLFPLQSSLGYDLSQTLFVGEKSLVVEGVTDFWYLNPVLDYLDEEGRIDLPDRFVITPASGAQKIPYLVSLLTAQSIDVAVLLDKEPSAEQQAEEIAKNKLIRDSNIIFASEAVDGDRKEADIEDILGEDIFSQLIQESYDDELDGEDLDLNENIPRVAKRYELAFQENGVPFHKTRPARLFLNKMGEDPEEILDEDAINRFEQLYDEIAETLEAIDRRDRGPFES